MHFFFLSITVIELPLIFVRIMLILSSIFFLLWYKEAQLRESLLAVILHLSG